MEATITLETTKPPELSVEQCVGLPAGRAFEHRLKAPAVSRPSPPKREKHPPQQPPQRPPQQLLERPPLKPRYTPPVLPVATQPVATQLETIPVALARKKNFSPGHNNEDRPAEDTAVSAVESQGQTRLAQLVADAKGRDPQALQSLRAYLDEHPVLYRQAGDLSRAAIYAFAQLAGGDSPLHCESVFKRAEEIKRRFQGDGELCPTEELLIEQIVICSVRLSFYDCQSVIYAESENTKLVVLMLQKHDSAQTQLYRAIAQLETFRRLRQPQDEKK